MPTYEYACEKCETEFEVEQRITDDPVKSCPQCRSRKVKRLISKTSFVLKGGGWYSDLYGSSGDKGAKSEAKDGGGSTDPGDKGSKSGDKSDGKSDGKSESSPDAKGASSSSPSPAPAGGGDKGKKKSGSGAKAAA